MHLSRRDWLLASAAALALRAQPCSLVRAAQHPAAMRLGLVTYLWGKDWNLPTLLQYCEKSGVLGVELRTTHAHGVEQAMTAPQRRDVKQCFADSHVTLVGLGSDERFDSPDPDQLRRAIDATQAFIRLSHDVGASGVKVKPDSFHDDVPRERTIEQIGRSLNLLGRDAADFNQQIRLEVHGQCSPLPIIRKIMDIADHPNVAVCWNSNDEDLAGQGLEHNFNLVNDRLGDTVHVRELNLGLYPYVKLMALLKAIDYHGWVLLEARTSPPDRLAALIQQREVFERMCGL